jgi:KDO2-lipid IV(A) lauroyltransferase
VAQDHPIRTVLELIGTRAARATVPALSRTAVLRMANGLGRVAASGAGHLRRVGMANLDLAYGDSLSPVEKRQILRRSLQSFCLVMLDVFWFGRDTEDRLRRHVRWDPAFLASIRDPTAKIMLTSHLGNWETLGQAVAAKGVPLMSVAAPLANKQVDEVFLSLRRASGQLVVPKEGAMLRLLRHLRKGGKVAMLLDQNVKPADGGAFVPFFGLPVPVSMAAATLALRLPCPIETGYMLPQPGGAYLAMAGERILPREYPAPDAPGAVETLTLRIAELCEKAVRRHPDLWLWSYKRWKHIPPGGPTSRYPFYSKRYPAATA